MSHVHDLDKVMIATSEYPPDSTGLSDNIVIAIVVTLLAMILVATIIVIICIIKLGKFSL